jgi:methionyl aminopeptidase
MENLVPILSTMLLFIDGKPEILSTFAYVYQALGIVSNEEDEFRRVPLVL